MASRDIAFTSTSGNVTGVTYDPETSELTVSFGDRVYTYANVPESVAMGFESAPSAGQYLNTFVKGLYQHTRVS